MDEKTTVSALKEIKKILDENNIDSWLSCGTLLGAIREKRIIPWDYDIDLATWEENSTKIEKILDEIQKHGFEVFNLKYQHCVKILKENCEIGIDYYHIKDKQARLPLLISNKLGEILDYILWTLKLKNPNLKRGKASIFLTKALVRSSCLIPYSLKKSIIGILEITYIKMGSKLIHVSVPEKYFKELTTINFYGMKFKAPKDADGYLEYTYGEDWRTPKKDFIYYEDDYSLIKE